MVCACSSRLARPEVGKQNRRSYPRMQKQKISWSKADLVMIEMQGLILMMWRTSLGSVYARTCGEEVVKGVLETGMVPKAETAQLREEMMQMH